MKKDLSKTSQAQKTTQNIFEYIKTYIKEVNEIERKKLINKIDPIYNSETLNRITQNANERLYKTINSILLNL